MTIPLATSPAPDQVEAVRPLLERRPCVIVGSAPLSTPQAEVDDDEVVVAVNGGISSAPRVDLWAVASRPQDRPGSAHIKPLHKAMLSQAQGRTVGHALLLRGPDKATEQDTLAALTRLACTVEAWSVLDKPTKQWLEHTLCGRPGDKEPCSSGILATAIALWCGAASVRLVGFSFTPGYHYLPKERPQAWWRNHIAADRRALQTLRGRYGAQLSGAILEREVA